MEDKTSLSNLGVVVSVRGSVVDIRFDGHLPPIYSVLRAGDEQQLVIEVLAQRDARHVRGIALTPTQGLARGMAVEDTGGPLKAPVGKGILSRMFDMFGNAIDREPALGDGQEHGDDPSWDAAEAEVLYPGCSRLPPARCQERGNWQANA